MDVTDVLRGRMHEPAGLQRMVVVSSLVHAALVAVFLLTPGRWTSQVAREPQPVMTITLGAGAPGVDSGGRTDMGGRAVQELKPAESKREAVTPPAAKAPEMTVPVPGRTPVKASPSPAVKQAPDSARGRTVSRGAEVAAGSTNVETNVRGQGFGLSTSSGASGTGNVRLDVANFCCPDYLEVMNQRIRQNWDPKAETPSEVTVFFTIQKDGTLTGATVEKSSGNNTLDIRAQRSIVVTRQIPPLPAAFPNSTLPVHLTFQYIR